MLRKRINVIMKVTNACDLRCIYCYNSTSQYSSGVMDITLIEELLKKVVGNHEEIHFIWHGGEPLLPGIEYYQRIFALEKEFSRKIRITNSIQTNATNITDEFAKLLHINKVNVGVSFDGKRNENTRGGSLKTLNGIEILKRYESRIPVIKVVVKEDIGKFINEYIYFNSLKLDLKLNYLFTCDLQNVKNHYSIERYIEEMRKLFLYWYNDKKCCIHLQPFEYYIAMLKGLPNRECTNASCLLSFLSMDYDGNIFTCSRFYENEFCYGNIRNIKNISEIYDSKGFLRILESAVVRRQKCSEACSLYKYCQGGCSRDALIDCGGRENNFFSCALFKEVFRFIQQYCKEHNTVNPMIIPFFR